MQDAPHHRSLATDAADESVRLASASRRRALLKGLGKAGAIAGAAVPLRSLATGDKPGMRLTKGGKVYQCSMSGQESLSHASHAPASINCSGNPLSHYKDKKNWPRNASGNPACIVGPDAYTTDKKFRDVFGNGSRRLSILELVNSSSPTAEAHWIVAMLNATKMAPTFPYTTLEVRAMYGNPDPRAQAAALDFFQYNLEGPPV